VRFRAGESGTRLAFHRRMLQQLGRVQAAPIPEPPLPRRIVALGGGTGLPAVLRSLRLMLGSAASEDAITAIVAVTDDGGSSGRLRRELHIPAPGDVRNCVAALATDASPLARLLQHRFTEGGFEGHTLGNLLIAGLTQQLGGDFASAIRELGRMVRTGGRVLPATAEAVHLQAECESGEVIVGETAIAGCGRPIRRLALERHVRPLPETIEALVNADAIIVGPGSLYTSVLPVLLTDGVSPTIYGLRATRIYVANLMTEPGETDDFTLERHLDVIERHVGLPLFDYVLVNNAPIAAETLRKYASNCAQPVLRATTSPVYGRSRIVERQLAWQVEGGKLRHEPAHLAAALLDLLERPARTEETDLQQAS
jgi:uncharacterized cofD-like protein